MKRITLGIFAHVDAGKTTLSEGLLYTSGSIRRMGRVDNRDTFLDTDTIERQRGITVFSKQALLSFEGTEITLLDTPGHADFAAEAERTLSVLDYAVLVISATDGVQSHTKTLWKMLDTHKIPTFIFVNKLDLQNAQKDEVLENLKAELSGNIVDFCDTDKEQLSENIAVCDDTIMNSYLETGKIEPSFVADAILHRNIFPVFSGSALKMEGIETLLRAISSLSVQKPSGENFGAKVFKIATDDRGQRLTFMKVTSGTLKVKEQIDDEKVNEIRIYSGEKYTPADTAVAGMVCAITGLTKTFSGQGLGVANDAMSLSATPVFSYRIVLPKGVDAPAAMAKFKLLEQEETQLNIIWNERLQEIQLKLMGEVQLEIIKSLIKSRFDMDVGFEESGIVYKETIKFSSYGVGHFEPLRHYAEVHLLLEPLPRGSGMQFATDCSEDILDKNWQRLIQTHLMEKQYIGVLTGSHITDIKITLKNGRAHNKHTEGGDFRQATYRAVRCALMRAESILLEPYFDFSLEVPKDNVGRAMTDLDRMGASVSLPETHGNLTKITGKVSAASIRNYNSELMSYTHGEGKLSVVFGGYGECVDTEKIIDSIAYDPESDVENTADSVFCEHGAGFNVHWSEIENYMHLENMVKPKKAVTAASHSQQSMGATDADLLKIFEKTYGKVETKIPNRALHTRKETLPEKVTFKKRHEKEYLLIDGYNIIHAWDDLKIAARESLEAARNLLIDRMVTYKIFKNCEIIIVFDAYKVKGNTGEVENVKNLTVVYTKEAQTADAYIEKCAKELSKNYRVTVATSDNLEQLIVFGSGAYRMSAKNFYDDVVKTEQSVKTMIEEYNIKETDTDFLKTIKEKLEEKKSEFIK